MKIGYARVSTRDQNPALQINALEMAGCESIFSESASGVSTERPKLDEMLSLLRPGDVVVIWKLDRLGRSLQHLIALVNHFRERQVDFVCLTNNFDTSTAGGRMVFNMFASFAEYEREINLERTTAGIAEAKRKGVVFGRPRKITIGALETAERLLQERVDDEYRYKVKEVAQILNIHHNVLGRFVVNRKIRDEARGKVSKSH